jgi:hypothetical protein
VCHGKRIKGLGEERGQGKDRITDLAPKAAVLSEGDHMTSIMEGLWHRIRLIIQRRNEMKRMLFGGCLIACLLPFHAYSQGFATFTSTQQITILPPSIASELNCCVLPFNKIFVGRLTKVLWLNESGSDVKLTINKGTDCREISGDRQESYVVESTKICYVIRRLPQGNTGSVRLSEPGQYDYTIEYLGTLRKPETASITVF